MTETINVLENKFEVIAIKNIDDLKPYLATMRTNKPYIRFNQRTRFLPDDTGEYVSKLGIMHDPDPILDGLELMGLSTANLGDLPTKGATYEENLAIFFDALYAKAMEEFVNPTHFVKVADEAGLLESWVAIDADSVRLYEDTSGKTAFSADMAVVCGSILTEKGLIAFEDGVKMLNETISLEALSAEHATDEVKELIEVLKKTVEKSTGK